MLKDADAQMSPLFDFFNWITFESMMVIAVAITLIIVNYLLNRKTVKNLTQEYQDLLGNFKAINKDLQIKSGQMSVMSLHMLSVDNNIEDFVKKTSENQLDTQQLKLEIRQFYKELKYNKQSLESIRARFDNIYPDFFEEMEEQYPQISKQDLKLMAFQKMNLSNKEISNIMNVTTGAVVQSKRRLKKKLGLKPEEKLNVFLDNYEKSKRPDYHLNLN